MAWTGQAVVALSVVGERQALRRLKVRAAPPRVPEGRHMGPEVGPATAILREAFIRNQLF